MRTIQNATSSISHVSFIWIDLVSWPGKLDTLTGSSYFHSGLILGLNDSCFYRGNSILLRWKQNELIHTSNIPAVWVLWPTITNGPLNYQSIPQNQQHSKFRTSCSCLLNHFYDNQIAKSVLIGCRRALLTKTDSNMLDGVWLYPHERQLTKKRLLISYIPESTMRLCWVIWRDHCLVHGRGFYLVSSDDSLVLLL